MQKHYPVFPLLRGDNRKEKRAMMNEFKRYSLKTAEIEQGFADFLFDKFWGTLTYDQIFKTYMGEYIERCKYIQDKLHPKYIVMNPEYFKEVYGVEYKMIKPSSVLHDINELIRQRLWFMQ